MWVADARLDLYAKSNPKLYGSGDFGGLERGPAEHVFGVDIRLPGKGNSNTHGARPVYYNHFDDQANSDQ